MAQNDKILCLLTSYLRKHTLYDRDCDMVNSSVKGKKMTQNDKKLCLLHPYVRKHTSYVRDFWYACIK